MELKVFDCLNEDMIRIRTQAFITGKNVPYDEEFDGRDSEHLHFCLYDNHSLVAYLRLEEIGDIIHIGRVCVDLSCRKRGYGAILIGEVFKYGDERGKTLVELSAVDTAVGFYEKMGFFKKGEYYPESGSMHIYMYKYLAD